MLMTLAGLTGLIQPALAVIGAFKGTAVEAKATGYIQDAMGIVGAVMPLIQQHADGAEVTLEDTRVALAGFDTALGTLDDLIKQKGG